MMTLQNEPPTLERNKDKKFTRHFKDMIDSCLLKDPRKRPSAEKLMQHVFFRSSKKPQFLVDSILKDLPPVTERNHQGPQQLSKVDMSAQSWDFPHEDVDVPDVDEFIRVAKQMVTDDSELFDYSDEESKPKLDDDRGRISANLELFENGDVPSKVRKSRFVVGNPAKPTSPSSSDAQFSLTHVETSAGPASKTPLHSRSSSLNHSNNVVGGIVVGLNPLPSSVAPPANVEIKKGRFSVIDNMANPLISELGEVSAHSGTTSDGIFDWREPC